MPTRDFKVYREEESRPEPQDCDGTLIAGRFRAEPRLVETHPETRAGRYEVTIAMEHRAGHLLRFASERELKDLARVVQIQLEKSGAKVGLTSKDLRDLRELGQEARNLIENYLKAGRSTQAWQWDNREKVERREERQRQREHEHER